MRGVVGACKGQENAAALADAAGAGREGPWFSWPTPERGRWETEPSVGRLAHGVPNRVDRLRCLGNAVVPRVGEYIGRLVVEHWEASHA